MDKVKDWLIIFVGVTIVAIAVFFFLMPSNLVIASVVGLAIVINSFVELSVSQITTIINIFLLIVGFLLVGKEFGVKTVVSALLMPLELRILEIMFPDNISMMGSAFVDMVCYVFLVSVGLAILFNRNASSGGLDIVAKIMNKYLGIELGKAMSASGMLVALCSAIAFEKEIVVLSILGTYVSGVILDYFIFGSNMRKRVCIISTKQEEITDYIINEMKCGATIYDAHGAKDNKIRKEIITIIDKSDFRTLMSFVNKIDKNAFVTVYNVNEVKKAY